MTNPLDLCAKILKEKKVDKFQCSLDDSKQHEMNLIGTDFSLIRTTQDKRLNITVIKDNRRGNTSINQLDETTIAEAIDTAIELSNTSQQDPDYDIAPYQEPQKFQETSAELNTDQMYDLLKDYTRQVPSLFPLINLMETAFTHRYTTQHFINSNGVNFQSSRGTYNLSSTFSSKEGQNATSFNYSGVVFQDLEAPLLERGSLKTLLKQSVEHLEAQAFKGKFVGDIIITPDCLNFLIHFYTQTFLRDSALIMGTSPFKDKLNQVIANEKLTLHSRPRSEEIAGGYFITDDGFVAEDITVIEHGVLKSFLLSQYGSKKTGLERAKNQGSCWILEAGNQELEEMISQVDRGLLVARFSGGAPSLNGDFSGVAKNSYYIEDGQIKYPVTETMIAGNLVDIFNNIKGISKEQIDYGYSLMPYILTSGVTISGN